jgi:photosystem II stability/assembly factor-like uncharacterized protein
MRSHKFIFILTFFLVALSAQAQRSYTPVKDCPQWQWLNPNPNGEIILRRIFSTTQGLVAYSNDSIALKSKDGGWNWDAVALKDTSGITIAPGFINLVTLQFINDSYGFFADSNGYIHQSTDGGMHWFPNGGIVMDFRYFVNFQMVTEKFGWEIVGEINNSSAFNCFYKFYTTTNAGKTWHLCISDSTIGNRNILSAAFFLDSLHGWVIQKLPGVPDSLLRTTDGGRSWSRALLQLPSDILSPLPFCFIDTLHGYGIAAQQYGNDFVYTADGGVTWMTFYSNLVDKDTNWQIAWNVDKSGIFSALFAPPPIECIGCTTTRLTIFGVTTDYGATWVDESSYPLDYTTYSNNIDVECFAGGKAGIITYGNELLVTTDHGKTWGTNSFCKTDDIANILFSDKNNGLALSGNLYRTSDAGRNWETVSNVVFPDYEYRYAQTTLNNIWVCDKNTAYRSIDSGKTFHEITSMPKDTLLTAINFVDSLYGWVFGSFDGIWKTTDGGMTWASQHIEQPNDSSNSGGTFRGASMVDREYGWVLQKVALRTTDGGATWDTMNIPKDYFAKTGLQFITRLHGFIYGKGPVHETTDGGITWNDLSFSSLDLHFRDSLFGWANGNVTIDGGITWQQKGCNLFGDGTLNTWWSDTSDGWSAPGGDYLIHYVPFDSVQVGVVEPLLLPFANALISNYPNPFNGTTNIELRITNGEPGTLKVYDMLGREVADLSKQIIPGSSTVQFDGSALPPGIYFCKWVFGAREFTSKLVVVQ